MRFIIAPAILRTKNLQPRFRSPYFPFLAGAIFFIADPKLVDFHLWSSG